MSRRQQEKQAISLDEILDISTQAEQDSSLVTAEGELTLDTLTQDTEIILDDLSDPKVVQQLLRDNRLLSILQMVVGTGKEREILDQVIVAPTSLQAFDQIQRPVRDIDPTVVTLSDGDWDIKPQEFFVEESIGKKLLRLRKRHTFFQRVKTLITPQNWLKIKNGNVTSPSARQQLACPRLSFLLLLGPVNVGLRQFHPHHA
ncbi:hypothetical protein LRY65_00785 [Candidatus Woesebacteria bacterium]|nr:hypothetical protein [Candidatus Woesebacteria bacterium]MCD8507684.1 hypothetical protein [Candidatus Woesebacteria bacterium]MCD8526733.1 hypothetical protein [Candidatus Woesebacteria bacterium]MCD8546524.1 hypothetical protein [Candidatus Woesebacteria bacterium]